MELRRGQRAVVRIGHRGAPLVAPENTIPSLEAALSLGVDVVEIDVLARTDGTLLVAHSPAGVARRDTPTLDEALAFLAERGADVQLDLKGRGLETRVADAVRRFGLVERSLVSTPSVGSLRALAAAEPRLARALTYPDDRFGLTGRRAIRPAVSPALAAMRAALPARLPRRLLRAGAGVATLDWRVVTPAVIRRCHEVGAAVYAWTVDDPHVAQTLVQAGTDGIITNDPGIFDGLLTT
ncbi:MAG TPA: glycerophosphodiester phosphodiesterase [Gaiellaceae bacterium]